MLKSVTLGQNVRAVSVLMAVNVANGYGMREEQVFGRHERVDFPWVWAKRRSIIMQNSGLTSNSRLTTLNQAELRQMAEERILDADALLKGGRWAFAYYVAGYAIECALKSCVLSRMIHTGGVFQDRKFAERCWTHDFQELVRLAGLLNELNATLAANPPFVNHWAIVRQWKETGRYESKTESEAKALFAAITHEPDGVLRWIRNYW